MVPRAIAILVVVMLPEEACFLVLFCNIRQQVVAQLNVQSAEYFLVRTIQLGIMLQGRNSEIIPAKKGGKNIAVKTY
jgi:hypothetical protein